MYFHVSLGRVLHTWTVCCARNHPLVLHCAPHCAGFVGIHLTVFHHSLQWTICPYPPLSISLILQITVSTSGLVQASRTWASSLFHVREAPVLLSILVIHSELFPHFQSLKTQRPNLHPVFRRQHTLNSYGGIISQSYTFRTISNAGFVYWLLWISRFVLCHHLQTSLLNANGWAHNPSLHREISPPCIATR